MIEHLFVYGLLRKKANHVMGRLLSDSAEFVSEASFQGKLYLIDYYPGVVSSESSSDLVKGDVFKLRNLTILKELDHFEGVGVGYDTPNQYRREIREVKLANGSNVKTWIYLYNWTVTSNQYLASGDFLNSQEGFK